MCPVDNQDSGNKTTKSSEQHWPKGERISSPVMGLDKDGNVSVSDGMYKRNFSQSYFRRDLGN